MKGRNLLLGLGLGIFVLALIFLLFPFLYALSNVYRPKMAVGTMPASYNLRHLSLAFPTSDGQQIRGWLLYGEPEAPLILVCHGLGTNREDLLGVSQFLREAGFSVLTFDFRGHGQSTGHKTTFGFLEAKDIEAAIQFIKNKYAERFRVLGLYAVSMGSAAAIFAAKNIPEVKAFVFDSPFAELCEVVAFRFRYLPAPLRKIFSSLANFYGSILMGINTREIAPEAEASNLNSRPVLVYHGGKDSLIPVSQGEKLFQKIPGPKEFIRIPGVAHVQSYNLLGKVYEQKIIHFFKVHLEYSGKFDST
ncbi:MAG: hypothetical protein DMG06_07970 [Acidobacteria bacterium]|nr:MAG: hypothetical protein DMG06_07970 [Acidobacteriota bacterium]